MPKGPLEHKENCLAPQVHECSLRDRVQNRFISSSCVTNGQCSEENKKLPILVSGSGCH